MAPNEPKPALGIPPGPRGLSREGRRYWKSIAPVLLKMRVLTEADGIALFMLAEAIGEFDRARKVVAKEGSTMRVTTKSGETVIPHPAVRISADAWRRAERMMAQFGLTPASRTRVNAVPLPAVDNGGLGRFKPSRA